MRYNIYYSGDIANGHDPASVRLNLGKLFKADDTVLDRLFSGKLQLLKKDCDEATASKYQRAMERAGAVPIVRNAEDSIEEPVPASSPQAPQSKKTMTTAERIAALAASEGDPRFSTDEEESDTPRVVEWASPEDSGDKLRVTPEGTEVLREHERPEPVTVDIQTDGLTLDEQAKRLSEEPAPPPPAPDTSHLDMGEAGEAIPNLRSEALPLDPDISALDLDPEGTDFSDCAKPDVSAPELDLSAMNLAEQGSLLLEEQFRKHEEPSTPNTDHLSLGE